MKSSWLFLARTGMALWLGAKIETINMPKSPRWTVMNSSACKGSSTENSKPKYTTKCAPMKSASVNVLFALFSMRNWMLLRCMLSPCRIDSGKIKAA